MITSSKNIQNEKQKMHHKSRKNCILFSTILLPFIIISGIATPLIIRSRSSRTALQSITISTSATNPAMISRTAIAGMSSTIKAPTNSTSNISTTSITKAQRSVASLTTPGDTIIGLFNTTAGGSTGGLNGIFPADQGPKNAIDEDVFTKYVNFGQINCSYCISYLLGVSTGFIVIPTISNATIARSLIFATVDDYFYYDPITVTLEGSNDTDITMLHQGSSWTLIYSGPTGLDSVSDPGRNIYVSPQNFSNTKPFASYRLLITSKRYVSNSVRYSESHILGYF